MIDFHISTILKPMVFMHFFQIFICIIFSDFDFYLNWYIFFSICCHLRCWKPLQLPHSLRFLCYSFFTMFFILLELSQYIVCGERPQQREGFQWHILAPRKTRSDLGRRDPVKAPNLRDLRKWKWIVLAHNLNREKVRVVSKTKRGGLIMNSGGSEDYM